MSWYTHLRMYITICTKNSPEYKRKDTELTGEGDVRVRMGCCGTHIVSCAKLTLTLASLNQKRSILRHLNETTTVKKTGEEVPGFYRRRSSDVGLSFVLLVSVPLVVLRWIQNIWSCLSVPVETDVLPFPFLLTLTPTQLFSCNRRRGKGSIKHRRTQKEVQGY